MAGLKQTVMGGVIEQIEGVFRVILVERVCWLMVENRCCEGKNDGDGGWELAET